MIACVLGEAVKTERRRVARVVALVALAFAVLPVAPASAGRLLATGHDADLHCDGGSQCGFVKTAVDYVRSGAPDPNKPVLILDRGSLQMQGALDAAYGPGVVPRQVVDPRSPEFRGLTLSTSLYSAILVASDASCGGCDLNTPDPTLGETPDSDAINARRNDIIAFFNAGGGLYANSGASHGDGDPQTGPDTYYGFLPLPVGGQQVVAPFCLTAPGRAIGLEDVDGCPDTSQRAGSRDDINCCPTHNSFQEPPAGSTIVVAERDANNAPETLIAEGVVSGGTIRRPGGRARLADLPPPVLGRIVNVAPVKGKVFVRAKVAGPKGRRFVALKEARQVPTGSLLDTRKGTVRIVSARDRASKRVQAGNFLDGVFQVLQSRKAKFKGLTELRLKGASFKRCRTGKSRGKGKGKSRRGTSRVRSSRARTIRRLSGSAQGRFRTRGRHSAATVRGTKWTVSDRCDGTLTKVRRGRVAVFDFRRKQTIVVRAGKSYLARAGG